MELRQIRFFQAICRQKGFTKAAEHLNISQPSITQSIQKLEDELGIVLFDRSQKQIQLTTEGEIFLAGVNEILSGVENIITEIKDYADLKKGSIKLGLIPMVAAYIFPQIFLEFKKEYPQIFLNIFEEGTSSIREMLKQGALDLGFGMLTSGNEDILDFVPFSQNQLLVCVSKKHPLSTKKEIRIEDLENESFIILKEGFYLRQLLSEYFKKYDFAPNIILSSSSLETIKSLVSNNIGIGFLLDNVITDKNLIVGIPLKDPLYVSTGLIWRKDRYLSKASQAFIDFVVGRTTESYRQEPRTCG
ncbi:MAG: LysR family transcriptional regulator [Peptococcaceae bacterium]